MSTPIDEQIYYAKSDITTAITIAKNSVSISPLHESVEPISENYGYLSTSLDNKKFWVTNAACFDETLNLRHLFRVIGCPSSGYLKGAIEVDTKKLFWFGRYALEYEKEE